MRLLTNAGNGDGTVEEVYQGGTATVQADGTFDGATVVLQRQGLDGAWHNVPDVSFATQGMVNVTIGQNMVLRGSVSGGGGSVSVNLGLTGRI